MSSLLIACGAGALAGAIFFGGLWWTVRRGLGSNVPAVWFLLSAVGRVGGVVAAFYWIARNNAAELVACVIGFTLVRWVATHAHQS